MSRRRKDPVVELVGGVMAIFGALIILGSPPGQAMPILLGLLMAGLILGALVILGFVLFQVIAKSLDPKDEEESWNRFASAPNVRLLDQGTLQSAPTLSEKLRTIDWFQFEKLMERAYRKQGYDVTRRGGANPDGGIDLVLEKENERIAVQCKHWKSWNVGVAKVRELIGAMTDAGIHKGVLVTLCGFTDDAKTLASRNSIKILNEGNVLDLLNLVDADYDPNFQFLLNDTRKYCPRCESEMVLRTARRGANAGSQFWGCSTYPRCRYVLRLEEAEN